MTVSAVELKLAIVVWHIWSMLVEMVLAETAAVGNVFTAEDMKTADSENIDEFIPVGIPYLSMVRSIFLSIPSCENLIP